MLTAVAARPHRRGLANALRYGYVDMALLAGWWLYLYGFFVLPLAYVSPAPAIYQRNYLELTAVENAVLLALLYMLWRAARGGWRRVYCLLFGAACLHALAWLLVRHALARGAYFTGSLLDVPLVASFLGFGLAGLEAYRLSPVPEDAEGTPVDHREALRVWLAGILSLPLFGAWAMLVRAPDAVRRYRVDLTLAAMVVGILLLLLRQQKVDRHRQRLLRDTTRSLDKMNRLQTQLVLTEKLASLGQLAA
jgi:hypothetical protein